MAKKFNQLPWEGDQKDLFKGSSVNKLSSLSFYVIKYDGEMYSFDGIVTRRFLHNSAAAARTALRKHIQSQIWRAESYHKGSGNTFEKEYKRIWTEFKAKHGQHSGGWGLHEALRKPADELTEFLIQQKIFTIEKVEI